MVGGKCRWLAMFEWSEAVTEEQANAGPRSSCHIFCRVTSTRVGGVGGRGTTIGDWEGEMGRKSKRHYIQRKSNKLSCW